MKPKHYSTLFFSLFIATILLAQERIPVLTNSGTLFFEENAHRLSQLDRLPMRDVVDGKGYVLIQFSQLPDDATLLALQNKGIQLLEYLPHNTYVAAVPQTFDPASLPSMEVRSVSDIPVELKMTPDLRLRAIPGFALAGNRVESILKFPKNISIDRAVHLCRESGITVLRHNKYNNFIRVQIPLSRLDEIAALPFVAFVDMVPPPDVPDDKGGRSLHRSNMIDNEFPSGRHYDGSGVNVLVRDDGVVGPHIDFQGRIDNSYVDPQLGTHGDGVAGVMAGAGNIDPNLKGMAAGAFVYVVNYQSDFLDETMDLFFDHNVIVTNSSYSNGCNAGYTAITETVDQQLYNNPTLMHVFSAGNSNNNDCDYGAGNQWGNITGGHKMAKNCIATANLYADATLVGSSSRGPAHDGRLKPDIAAHGQGQLSTTEENLYQVFGGTSAAAPCIAGVMAQLHQAYRGINNGQTAEAALLKAVLLNTVNDLGNTGPDFKFGWGQVNAYRAALTLEDKRHLKTTVAPNQNTTQLLSIPPGVKEARIMLYWMDPDATPMATKALINDLDLKVIGPDGTEYFPWVLDPTPNESSLDAPATKGVDTLNNVEQVSILNPAAGDYTLLVNGKQLPFGTHPFFLTWEFRNSDITLTYPAGGESFEPGDTIRIHWDAHGDNGFFLLWLSADDGATYAPINSIEGDQRLAEWIIPGTVITATAKLKVTRIGSNQSENSVAFAIAPQPKNLQVTQACPDFIRYEWDPVDLGAASTQVSYEVLVLGGKYMEPLDTVSDTFYELPTTNQDPGLGYWLTVRTLGDNGLRSERAIAMLHDDGLLNCTQQIDLALTNIEAPALTTLFGCGSAQTKVSIEVTNEGLTAKSGFSVAFQLDAQAPVIELVPGSLAPGESLVHEFSTPLVIMSSGAHTLSLGIIVPDDQALFNNSEELLMEAIIYQGPGEPVEYNEHFEGQDFPPPYYLITNPDDFYTWERRVITGPTGDTSQVLFVNNRLYNAAGEEDYIQVVPIDLSVGTKPQLSFDLAYTYRSNLFDRLIVELSTDCGQTYEVIFDKSGPDLATVPAQNGFFAPSAPSHWRKEKLDISDYIGNTILLRFTNVTGRGNSLYLDNINVKEITPPAASFTLSADTICQGETITFYNTSTGPDVDVLWEFGNGANPSTSTKADSVVVTFTELGEYNITLSTTNIAGQSTAASSVLVRPVPAPDFGFTNVDATVSFENLTQFGDSFVWNFGDGFFALTSNPSHTYASFGSYTVTLTVTNDCGTTSIGKEVNVMATATADLSKLVKAVVSPNPNSGTFKVSLFSDRTEELMLTLLDLRGVQLDQRPLGTRPGRSDLHFDSPLSPGMYFLKLSNRESCVVLKVVVE